jgi:predicted GTPase
MKILHFQDAVLEHTEWWDRFERFLNSEGHDSDDAQLRYEDIVHDDKCAIGRWLHGDGAQFAEFKSYQRVKSLHKDLHDLSGRAWQAKTNGEMETMASIVAEIKVIRHELFMAWSALNEVVGSFD